MRTLAKGLFVVVAVLAFTVLSIYAYLSVLDPGEFRDDISKVVKGTTGRELTIDGEVLFKIFPAPKLLVENVSLSNADWGSRPTLMSVDRVIAEVALIPLFSRAISIRRVVLVRPVLNLERNSRGESNWNLWKSTPSPAVSGALTIDVSNVDVRDGRISYSGHGAGSSHVLKMQRLKLRSKGLFQPVEMDFQGQFNKRAVSIRGETGSLASLFKNEAFSVDVSVSSSGVEAKVSGRLNQPMELRGLGADLWFSLPDLGRFLNTRGRANGGHFAVTGRGHIRDDKKGYIVEKLELSVGGNDLSGSVSFGLVRGRGHFRGSLRSKMMDVDSLFAQRSKNTRASGTRFIPAWRFPVEALRAVDADIDFSGRRVTVRGVALDGLKLNVALHSGRLRIEPRGKLYGGRVDGQIDLNATASEPRLLMEISGSQVGLGELLNAMKKKRVMSGAKGQLHIKIEGKGATLSAVAAGMNGRFLTSMGSGQIYNSALKRIGADALMQLVRTFDPTDKSDQATNMQCGVILFNVENGVAKTDREVAAETKRMNVIGSGTIDLGTEAIDLVLRAQPRDGVGISAGALGNVVRVSGTLAAPKTRMDAVGALKTGASVGAAVATSGISLLVQGLFNRLIADSSPCKTALNVTRSQRQAAPQSPSVGGRDRNSR
jgi:uncharacterized protein involved in outer membrane biogenesis